MADKAADDAKGGTALDKLLKGLDAMASKIDSFGSRMDALEKTKRADADAPPPPPPPEKAPPPPVEGEGKPVPVAADIKKDAAPPDATPPVPPPAPPAADTKKDALPPEFLEHKKGPGDEPPKDKEEAADSVGELNVLRKRLAALEKAMPKDRTDHDLAADQARADSVYSLFGEQAPRPLIGDSKASYVLRHLEKFKSHSPAWKGIDLAPVSVDEKVLDIATDQIYAAARAAASNPVNVPAGTLRPIQTRSAAGHLETRFMGSPSAWMNRHAPNRRFVTAINLKKD